MIDDYVFTNTLGSTSDMANSLIQQRLATPPAQEYTSAWADPSAPKGGAIPTPKGGTGQEWQRGKGKFGLDADFWTRLARANTEMAAAGLGTFSVTDGFRSYAQQVAVKKKKGKLAATPGRSKHGLGLAADLNLSRSQQKWLEANARRLGIRRLPSESWHWEPLR